MDIIGLIKNVLLALAAYLELRNKTFFYDINERSRKNQQDLVNEIEKLRAIGTNDSNDRADLLRARLIKEREYIEHISAQYSPTKP